MGVYLTERPRLRLIGLRIETVLSETREQRMIPRLSFFGVISSWWILVIDGSH
ncbi:hypothetical protein PM3016_4320 [Paenibacillus mucilaginosus 3016]|uniref:Uncharacterized protein n=1 Tax=Paenibacillus mucilaginosus 3016 TaxID=1116391 RepID=H6NP16_9BACL|nr:hypothetical protein PM3016_4320 [Paenibacillus mucilaginosus 3016]